MPTSPWLGVIADDYTGASDVAGMIARQGMRVVQHLGVPDAPGPGADGPGADDLDVDVVVVALKSRSSPAEDAVADSLGAARWLRGLGIRQLYFKYCSTFDSTDAGNIGPVADALAGEVGAAGVVFCPATPEHGRTTYAGHHFVHGVLLSESPMRDHPITPMRDPDLRRVLARQTATPVGLVPLAAVRGGSASEVLGAAETRTFFVADAVLDEDVAALAAAVRDAPLVTGGAALAAALAALRLADGPPRRVADVAIPSGPAVVLAGSCSTATRRQLDRLGATHPRFQLDAYALAAGEDVVGRALAFIREHRDELPIVAASSDPEAVAAVHADLGVDRSAHLIESALGEIARGAVGLGVTRLLVAGGESSGAVVNGLGVRALRIGREVAPGVPWTVAADGAPVGLLLKSGNFGGDDIFTDALALADAS